MLNRLLHFYPNKYIARFFNKRRFYISYDFKHKAIWYRNYKVGTRSIDNLLRENCGFWDYIYSSRVAYFENRYQDYFKFGFVRNPIEKFVSAWKDKVVNQNYFKFPAEVHEKMKDISNFITWVEGQDLENCDEHLVAQYALIDLDQVDFIGRFENFNEDLKKVADRLGIPLEAPKHLNKSGSSKIQISQEEQHRIAKLYHKDIELFYPDIQIN